MKTLILFCAIFLALFACNKDEAVVVADDDMPPAPKECVMEEMPVTTQDSFEIFGAGEMEDGFAVAIKLNREFEASAFAKITEEEQLFVAFTTFEETNDVSKEIFYFAEVPLAEGCYKVMAEIDSTDHLIKARASYDRVDDDVIWGGYEVLEEESNFLQIDSLDLVNKFVSGEFMASFVLDMGFPSYETPAYIRFLNGRFECAIIE